MTWRAMRARPEVMACDRVRRPSFDAFVAAFGAAAAAEAAGVPMPPLLEAEAAAATEGIEVEGGRSGDGGGGGGGDGGGVGGWFAGLANLLTGCTAQRTTGGGAAAAAAAEAEAEAAEAIESAQAAEAAAEAEVEAEAEAEAEAGALSKNAFKRRERKKTLAERKALKAADRVSATRPGILRPSHQVPRPAQDQYDRPDLSGLLPNLRFVEVVPARYCLPRHQTQSEPSHVEFNGILTWRATPKP